MAKRPSSDGGSNRRGPGRRTGYGGRSGGPIVRRGTMRLQHDVARRVRAGHPWIYRDDVRQRPMRENPGAPIELVNVDGEFVARGVFDGEGTVLVRILTVDRNEALDDALIDRRVRSAIALRRRLFDFDVQQCLRLVHAEADGLPGIVVDRYNDYLVVQLFSTAVEAMTDALYDSLERELGVKAIYEQRRFRSLGGDGPKQGAQLVRGSAAPVELSVREGDLSFWVDVTAPLATGLFPDLRLGREAIARWSSGRRVLNLFSYTGAISVYAKHGGATEVVAVDVAAKAHARARKNFSLNDFDAEKPEHIVGDAFKVLTRFAERNRRFDMVVIDPPAFASGSRGGKPWSAVKDYSELVAASISVLEAGGVLSAASATHKHTSTEFEMALAEGAARAGTRLRIVERQSLPPDFPTLPAFPEGNYLKFVVAVRD